MNKTVDEISDFEITAHIFRLVRDGGFKRADALLKQAAEDMPTVQMSRIRACAAKLARRISE